MTLTTLAFIVGFSTVVAMAWDAIGLYPSPAAPNYRELPAI